MNNLPDLDSSPPMTSQSPADSPAAKPRRFKLYRRPEPSAEELSDRQIRKWSELWATIILSVATLITAWSGYEAGKWNGLQTSLNVQSTRLTIESSRLKTEAQETLLIDIGLFTNWVEATGNGNTQLADFLQARFRDDFRPAFEAWVATQPLQNPDAPDSPFTMAEYRRPEMDEAELFVERAGQLSISSEQAGSIADQYTLSVVILAGALLLAGLADRFEWAELRAIVVAVAMVILLVSIINVIRLPIA